MTFRVSSIIGWTAAILVAAFNVMAVVMKFMPVAPGSEAELMMQRMGTAGLEYPLGILEGIITILFLIPRTMTVGFVLMTGYLAGALATILTHGGTHADMTPLYVLFALLTVAGYLRHPELVARLKGKTIPA